MDAIVFYQPSSASRSQPLHLPGALTSLNASRASIASLSRQTTSELDQWNRISKDHATKSRDVSELSQQSYCSDQHCRNDIVEEQDFTGPRNSPTGGRGDDDDFPEIDELLSGMIRKNSSARAEPDSGDDKSFVDTYKLLSGITQESVNSDSIVEKVDSGSRGSPADSTRSTEGSSQDPIMLSDDESVAAESETDYSDLDVHTRAKRASDGFSPRNRTTHASCSLAANQKEDGSMNNNSVVSDTQLRLSPDRPGSDSPGHGSVTHRASEISLATSVRKGYILIAALIGGLSSSSYKNLPDSLW